MAERAEAQRNALALVCREPGQRTRTGHQPAGRPDRAVDTLHAAGAGTRVAQAEAEGQGEPGGVSLVCHGQNSASQPSGPEVPEVRDPSHRRLRAGCL